MADVCMKHNVGCVSTSFFSSGTQDFFQVKLLTYGTLVRASVFTRLLTLRFAYTVRWVPGRQVPWLSSARSLQRLDDAITAQGAAWLFGMSSLAIIGVINTIVSRRHPYRLG